MKKLFKSFGKSILYVLLFLGIQFLVSFAVMFAIALQEGTRYALMYGGALPQRDIMDLINEKLLEQTMTMSIVSGIVTILFLVIFFAVRKKNILKEVRFNRISVGNAVLCAILGLGLNFAISIVLSMIPFPQSWIDSYAEASAAVTYGSPIMMFVASVIVAPIVEELVFRGLVFTRLRRALPQILAMLIASVAFGIVHGTIIWCIYIFVFAMILNFIYIRFNSLLANILVHLGFNAGGMMMAYLPELSDVFNIVYYVVCVICFVVTAVMLIIIAQMTKEHRIFMPDPEPVKIKYQPYQVYQNTQYVPYQPIQPYTDVNVSPEAEITSETQPIPTVSETEQTETNEAKNEQ